MTKSLLCPRVYTVDAVDSFPITREPSLSFADLLCQQFSSYFVLSRSTNWLQSHTVCVVACRRSFDILRHDIIRLHDDETRRGNLRTREIASLHTQSLSMHSISPPDESFEIKSAWYRLRHNITKKKCSRLSHFCLLLRRMAVEDGNRPVKKFQEAQHS